MSTVNFRINLRSVQTSITDGQTAYCSFAIKKSTIKMGVPNWKCTEEMDSGLTNASYPYEGGLKSLLRNRDTKHFF